MARAVGGAFPPFRTENEGQKVMHGLEPRFL